MTPRRNLVAPLLGLTFAALSLTGCAYLFDRRPPQAPGGGLTISNVDMGPDGAVEATLTWSDASDNYAGASSISYCVYTSTSESAIASLATTGNTSAVTPATAWMPGGSTTTITGLTPGKSYYFNLAARDRAGNVTYYESDGSVHIDQYKSPSGNLVVSFGPLAAGGRTATVNLGLGSTSEDAYLLFTNATTTDQPSPTLVSSDRNGSAFASPAPAVRTETAGGSTVTIREPASVLAFREHPAPMIVGARSVMPAPPPPQQSLVVGTSTRNYYDDSGNTVPSTLEAQNTATVSDSSGVTHTQTLNVWAQSDQLSTAPSPPPNPILQSDCQTLADNFLKSGAGNDIYDWVTNIYGQPWGTNNASNLIDSSTYNNTVNILFADLGGSSSGGWVVGFFYARDNYLKTNNTGSATDYSNQQIMFYLNSNFYYNYGGTGLPTQAAKDIVYSTLAHEFQHMIHFYQKSVLLAPNGTSSDTWINEMMSMVTEDLVADKLHVAGPRNVSDSTNPSGDAGGSNNTDGRIPLFNYYDDEPLFSWNSSLPLPDYSASYSFGAYLARNFGGAKLMHDIMHNKYTDYRAVIQAVADSGSPLTLSQLLSDWAASVVMSDTTDQAAPYRFNTGAWMSDTDGPSSIQYNLGSINFYNYDYTSQTGTIIQSGPLFYSEPLTPYDGSPQTSNLYFTLGTSMTGNHTERVTAADGTYLSVILRPH